MAALPRCRFLELPPVLRLRVCDVLTYEHEPEYALLRHSRLFQYRSSPRVANAILAKRRTCRLVHGAVVGVQALLQLDVCDRVAKVRAMDMGHLTENAWLGKVLMCEIYHCGIGHERGSCDDQTIADLQKVTRGFSRMRYFKLHAEEHKCETGDVL